MAATMTQIAKEAKVSVSLVSRFLNNDSRLRIADETRQRIVDAKDRLGGVKAFRSARNRSGTLAYNFVEPHTDLIRPEVVERRFRGNSFGQRLKTVLKCEGFRLSLTFYDDDRKLEELTELMTSAQYCDGLILFTGIVDVALAREIHERRFPHVAIDVQAEKFRLNTLCVDWTGGLRDAVDHLRELGHRQIGYLGPKQHRYPYFCAAMAEADLPMSDHFNCAMDAPELGSLLEDWTRSAREAFGHWLDAGRQATAIVCHSDWVALGALDAMRERELEPGRDLSIVGYDNHEQRGPTPVGEPVLTTIDNPMDRVGERCGELLINQVLHKQRGIVHERIPTRLIVRETTGPAEAC